MPVLKLGVVEDSELPNNKNVTKMLQSNKNNRKQKDCSFFLFHALGNE